MFIPPCLLRVPFPLSSVVLCGSLVLAPTVSWSQVLPSEWTLNESDHTITLGKQPVTGLYQGGIIREVGLQFEQPNYWDLLLANQPTNTRMPATLVVDGVSYPEVGVRLRGNPSPEIEATLKWSFNIDVNFYVPGQNVMGYTSILLDNSSNDPSFMREFLFSELTRAHVPVPKANFTHLTLNGEDWGLYPSIQATNSPYLREWFFTNNGSLWKAERPDGQSIGTNGDGTAALNYLGPDTSSYQEFYTLERSEQNQPWEHLKRVCDKLNNTPLLSLRDTMEKYMDVDRALWFLATEITFSDRASYVRRGKDDYLLYQDGASDRMAPLVIDARTSMRPAEMMWSPFLNEGDPNYPLLNKLLAVPELRQRYLAHLRTIISEKMTTAGFSALLNAQVALIDAAVNADPRKLFTYAEFQNEQTGLMEFINARRLVLQSNGEVAQQAPTISNVEHRVNNVLWADALSMEAVNVRATVTSTNGISNVRLYYSYDLKSRFERIPMFDDGLHNDGAANDGVFGATIPGASGQRRARYYVEAASANAAQSVSYSPVGAEHDVYTYLIVHPTVPLPTVRINEVMALNTSTVMDNFGEWEDWIEFFNPTGSSIDLSGHWLSDDGANIQTWQFPGGSVIMPNGYMIIWADDDTNQGSGHANFKLSGDGDEVWLSTPQGVVMDQVVFGAQQADMGYARVPNGTGPFVIQPPTFIANNNTVGIAERDEATGLVLFPNPASQQVFLRSATPTDVVVLDALGRRMWEQRITGQTVLDVSKWTAGTYFLRTATGARKLMVVR